MYFFALAISFILSIVFTLLVKRIALWLKIIDTPDEPRKIHSRAIPLLGGLAIFFAFFASAAFFWDFAAGGLVKPKNLIGLLVAASFLMLGGFLDDKYKLKPSKQIVWPVLAVLAVIIAGLGIRGLANPFGGGIIDLAKPEWVIFWWNNIPYRLTLLADIFTLLWLLGMMYTTKFLDGLDGLVPGITVIGSGIIFFLSIREPWNQPQTAMLAVLLAGAALGFLIFNFYPAKIFLGEGGSLFCGFMLGSLAIISGSKIATTALIVGIPAMDVLWVILRRVFKEKHSPFLADKKHLHFRLLDIGFSHRQAVIFLWFLSLIFGLSALFLHTQGRLIALIVLLIIMAVLAGSVVLKLRARGTRS